MDDPVLNKAIEGIESVAGTVAMLARMYGVTPDPEPIDRFVDAAALLSDADVSLDRTETLLVKLQRAGVISDQEGTALHVAYLHQQGAETRHLSTTRAEVPTE